MDQINPYLATNLHRIRTERGWSLDETAAVVGLDASLIDGIERGMSVLGHAGVDQLARRLEVPVAALLEPIERPAPQLPPDVAG